MASASSLLPSIFGTVHLSALKSAASLIAKDASASLVTFAEIRVLAQAVLSICSLVSLSLRLQKTLWHCDLLL